MRVVAIKFCGGCDPAYERVKYWESIKRAAGRRIRWVRIDEGPLDAVLLINGCERACPHEGMPESVRLVCLTSDALSPEIVVNSLMEKEHDENKN